MTKTIYIRNLLVFILFVAILFATPFVFAAEESAPNIRLGNIELPMNSRYHLQQQQTVLGANTVIQFPDVVAQHMVYENGAFNLSKTIGLWHDLARDGRAPGMRGGLFPVKVIESPNGAVDTESKTSIGYVDLGILLSNPGSYRASRSDIDEIEPEVEVEPASPISTVDESNLGSGTYDDDVYGSYYEVDDVVSGGGQEDTAPSDATVVDPVHPNTRPVTRPRPFVGQQDALQAQASFRCENEWERNHVEYPVNNCLSRHYGDDLRGKVQHILNDLEAINQLRAPRVPVDPRFSICIGENESKLSPNATNGGAWGMYQVRRRTGEEAISNFDPVVPGFEHLNTAGEYRTYRERMLTSPLAQADLHHSVMLKKAEYAGLLQKMGSPQGLTMTDWKKLARRYNASTRMVTRNEVTQEYKYHYANMITDCFRALQPLVNEYGQIADGVTSRELREALNKAHF